MERGSAAALGGERFEGGIFCDELEGGRAGVSVMISAEGVKATTAEGIERVLPFDGAAVELGGASGKMWFVRTPDRSVTIFSEDPRFGRLLAAFGGTDIATVVARITTESERSQRRNLLGWGAGLLVFGVLAFGFVSGLRSVAAWSLTLVPASVDKQLGDFAVEHMDFDGEVTHDKLLESTVHTLLERLTKDHPSKFEFHVRVLQGSTVNAFALPGGQLVVYTGLLREAESAEQVAGVLAHEIAHVTRRHGMQRIAQSAGVVAAIQLVFGDVSGLMAVATELMRESTINGYSREHEHEADMDGVATLTRAHVEASALADFFSLLERRHQELPAAVQWLGTHPELASRVRDVRAAAKQHRVLEPKPFALDWQAVRVRAGHQPDTNDTDEKTKPAATAPSSLDPKSPKP